MSLHAIDCSFKGWLYRCYLDLGPSPADAPFHVRGIDLAYRSLVEDTSYSRIESSLNASFREALIAATGLHQYDVAAPTELPDGFRTEQWQRLCSYVDAFGDLPRMTQVRLGWVLSKLCFHRFVLDLLPASVDGRLEESDAMSTLAYLRAWSRYRLWFDDPAQPYSLAEFERIATQAPPGLSRIHASYQMVVQNAKLNSNLAACERWQVLHAVAIADYKDDLDEFSYQWLMSRYHRVGGFLPQMRRDKDGVAYEMARAEEIARALPREDPVQRVVADEMLFPCLESRMQEALWIGDLDLALERIKEYVSLSPLDPRAWLHQGEVLLQRNEVEGALSSFQQTIRLAPPGEEIAFFMAGQCYEIVDDLESAFDSYLNALRVDPLGFSSAERLEEVAIQLGQNAAVEWVRTLRAGLRDQAFATAMRQDQR